MKSTLQLFLERLDQHNEKVIGIYREMLEFRARIAELLRNGESEVTIGDDGVWEPRGGALDLQASYVMMSHDHSMVGFWT